jgi:hypothetical protein
MDERKSVLGCDTIDPEGEYKDASLNSSRDYYVR